MRIVNLIENTEGSSGCLHEHGLSFYVETKGHKLLVDAGATDRFLENADKLGIDLGQVELMVLTHGHYDHAGGLLEFSHRNPDARILMRQGVDGAFYHKNDLIEKYIGIDPAIIDLPQAELLHGDFQAAEGIFLFGGVTGRRLWPAGNRELKVKLGEDFVQDDFGHEQYLVLEEDHKKILISGCAHNGILNILDRFREIYGTDPDAVISGFHMRKKSEYREEELEIVRKVADELVTMQTIFYTGHCTGETPYRVMKEIMGKQLVYVHSGDEIRMG